MNCPLCNTELVIRGESQYQNLDEHVCDPNGIPSMKPQWRCTNIKCILSNLVFWDEEGSLYVEDYDNYNYNKKHFFPNLNTSAMNSFDRKMSIEIYASGLKKDTWFNLIPGKLQLKIERKYKSNYMGEVLDKDYRFKILVKSKKHDMFLHWNPIGTLKYLYGEYKRAYKGLCTSSKCYRGVYLERLFKNALNDAFVYRFSQAVRDWVFSKEREEYLKLSYVPGGKSLKYASSVRLTLSPPKKTSILNKLFTGSYFKLNWGEK